MSRGRCLSLKELLLMQPVNSKNTIYRAITCNLQIFIVSVFVLLVVPSNARSASSAYGAELAAEINSRYSGQRQIFVDLQDLISDGDHDQAASKLTQLEGYPLASHLEYLLLRKQIENSKKPLSKLAVANEFQQRHQDSRSHRRLLGELKNRAVKLGRWSDYSVIASSNNTPVHPCDDLLSQVKNNKLKAFNSEAGKLWALPAQHTKNCDTAFTALIEMAGDVPTAALWRRTVALLTSGQKTKAREMLRFYNKRDGTIVGQWVDQISDPAALLTSPALRGKSEHHRRLAKYLLRRWGREDLIAATEFWRKHAVTFGFSSKDIAATVNKNAVLAAKRGMPEAADLLAQASSDDRGVRYWRVRIALRSLDWSAALQYLDQLTAAEQLSPRWQYWRARSLSQLGYALAAEKIYLSLSAKFEYYGFLAADQLGIAYQIDVSEPQVAEAVVQNLLSDPQIARALEFFLVGIAWEGRREWNNALKEATDQQLIAAAHIALSLGWYDRAYFAIKRTSQKSALAFLFPTPYQELVSQTASNNVVAEELVYGVMRQESGFIPDVKSPAGAIGLMQLMPGTAKDMGKKLGINAPAWKLINSELNIRLGVEYLNFVLQRFNNNVVLAAAAYNAGPHRVERWVEGEALPADVWVETIPFDETRDYVKGVLFNTTVSDWRLQNGALTRLKIRMPDVLPLG